VNVLEQYEFHVQIAEEDVRDGDATPWERVVAGLAAELRRLRENEVCADTECRDLHIRELRARVAELETQCDRCGLKLAHDPTPGITVCQSELTFTPGEVIYIPATVRYYPSATPGEPDVKEETYP